jgi:tetratricopeptide (TPR) repeat protein
MTLPGNCWSKPSEQGPTMGFLEHSGPNVCRAWELEQARNAYERLIALSPKDHAVFNNLALLFERQGYWERAVESFRKQIEVHPGDANATVNLPRALMHLGRWAEAEQAAVVAARAQPANAPQRATVTVARVCQDKIADPRQELDVALGSSPSTSTLTPAF